MVRGWMRGPRVWEAPGADQRRDDGSAHPQSCRQVSPFRVLRPQPEVLALERLYEPLEACDVGHAGQAVTPALDARKVVLAEVQVRARESHPVAHPRAVCVT